MKNEDDEMQNEEIEEESSEPTSEEEDEAPPEVVEAEFEDLKPSDEDWQRYREAESAQDDQILGPKAGRRRLGGL